MKKIVVLSGKGGVGKSSITASLAVLLAQNSQVIAVDCDVDAANLALTLGVRECDMDEWQPIETSEKAGIEQQKCTQCGNCSSVCYFGAIRKEDDGSFSVKKFGCEGCGACELVCLDGAIRLQPVKNAHLGYAQTRYDFEVVSGQLTIGESGSGKIVAAVREMAQNRAAGCDFMLLDAAAGIGCPVIASVVGSDLAILVTEPTPSALSDLQRAYGVVEHFGISAGLIVNKWDINPEFFPKVREFAQDKNIEVLARIPYNKAWLHALVNLIPVVEYEPEVVEDFQPVIEYLRHG